MRPMKTIAVVIMVLLLGRLSAQGQTVSRDALSASPAPDSVHARLGFLVGNFTTETTIPPVPEAPKGATGKGTSVIAWALDSKFLLIDEESMNSLFGRYKGHGVLGFDAQTQQFELTMFNNFGDHLSYKGNFVGDTLVLATRVPMPKMPFDQKILWYRQGERVRLKVFNDLGKGFDLALDQTATPVKQLPR